MFNPNNPKLSAREKIDILIDNWNRVVAKLENFKAPENIQESAKKIKENLTEKLHKLNINKIQITKDARVTNSKKEIQSIDKFSNSNSQKQKFNQEKRNKILEKLKQNRERDRGVQR
jgi:hypothetical protein